ncbi:hypothetical protein M4951_10325 [Blastopirellula sp. J2-11]|uniref:hypothetical protein n=1 Tax=Blastopirellula sp. J2-11 TaxID=2943192 RepID=UPI0021C749B3|nr:hypothetical protein [Blastopirellula sp. J2-11]UUO08694.1 hypothetical protein M4951_10325 [Blastopirellula sp. J2-11]
MATQYIGKAGHLAVMSEFCIRGYNVAMPEIDIGDDVFVVNDTSGAYWRIQVKGTEETRKKRGRGSLFSCRVLSSAVADKKSPKKDPRPL